MLLLLQLELWLTSLDEIELEEHDDCMADFDCEELDEHFDKDKEEEKDEQLLLLLVSLEHPLLDED